MNDIPLNFFCLNIDIFSFLSLERLLLEQFIDQDLIHCYLICLKESTKHSRQKEELSLNTFIVNCFLWQCFLFNQVHYQSQTLTYIILSGKIMREIHHVFRKFYCFQENTLFLSWKDIYKFLSLFGKSRHIHYLVTVRPIGWIYLNQSFH